MTVDPKTTFLANSSIVKAELQSIALQITEASASLSPTALSDSVLASWRAQGVVSEADSVSIRASVAAAIPPGASGAAPVINFQAIVDMIAALELILSAPPATPSSGLSAIDASVASNIPVSVTHAGNPGQFYIDGTSAFWLCVSASRWVRLLM